MEVELGETSAKILRFVVTMIPIGLLDLALTMLFVTFLKVIETVWSLFHHVYMSAFAPDWWIRLPQPEPVIVFGLPASAADLEDDHVHAP
ncbi:hypothetical protein AVEN_203723-1 [Araneus ventricosus]|uniref:Uncharacterized protein n=1 Tax=Araneus ventricosus TaxID=182803 RepID=A0A4Y2IQS9_ARAVE|nr:hypothetical protein AVEN_203723-1 [Araneus ventricosus]